MGAGVRVGTAGHGVRIIGPRGLLTLASAPQYVPMV